MIFGQTRQVYNGPRMSNLSQQQKNKNWVKNDFWTKSKKFSGKEKILEFFFGKKIWKKFWKKNFDFLFKFKYIYLAHILSKFQIVQTTASLCQNVVSHKKSKKKKRLSLIKNGSGHSCAVLIFLGHAFSQGARYQWWLLRSKKLLESFLRYGQKTSKMHQNWGFSPICHPFTIFFQKSGPVNFHHISMANFM